MKPALDGAMGQRLLWSFEGTEPPPAILTAIREQQAAGVTLFRGLNLVEPVQIRTLTSRLQRAAAEAGRPPVLIAADQEGGQLLAVGGATPFPGNMALGAAGSPVLAYDTGRALGLELAALGINVDYAPVCDVNNNPANPVVGVRSFGQDPAAVARLAAALVQGLQSAGVAATAKHFPGHGDTSGDSHHGLPVEPHDRERLNRVELPPFAAAIAAGVRLVMTAHLAFPGLNGGLALPSTLSRVVLEGMLRRDLGFRGVIVTDAMNMAAIQQGNRLVVDVLAAARAGADLILLLHSVPIQQRVYAGLLQAAGRRLLSPAGVMRSAGRVLALKRWLGGRQQPGLAVVGCAEHQALASQIAAQALTLVRDETHLLPLRLPAGARLAIVVPQPADLTPADTSSYERSALAGAMRRYHPLVDELIVPHVPTDSDIAAVRARARHYDLVIAGTINAFAQPGQAALVRALLETGVPTVVIALRLPYDLQAYPDAPTYVCTYSLLQPSMAALAQALVGEIAFAGHLPVAIPGMYPTGHPAPPTLAHDSALGQF